MKFYNQGTPRVGSCGALGPFCWGNKVMSRKSLCLTSSLSLFVCASLSVSLLSGANSPSTSSVRQGPRVLPARERTIGHYVPDTEFQDVSGKTHSLSEFSKGKGIVVAVTSTSCPLSKKYLPTLIDLAKDYDIEGITFLLLNPTPTDKPADIQEAAQRLGKNGIYIHDKEGKLASLLGLTSTTDAILLDPSRTVRFHGAVDDQYGFGYTNAEPKHHYLINAMNEFLKNEPIVVKATEAPGCHLDVKPAPAPEKITYHNRISRLIQTNCGECHREGGVSPFSLTSYADVVAHAAMIETVVEGETMPPWFAVPVEGEEVSPWLNDCSLNESDKTDLLAWLKSDKLEGDPKNAVTPETFPGGWTIGEPDLVVKFPEAIPVQATGTMPYKHVTVETKLTEDKWVQAIEVRPSAPDVVHHVLVFGRTPKAKDSERRDSPDDQINYWGIYVPGNSKQVFPEGFGRKLPRGSVIRFQMHYTPNGTATEDRTEVGFVFADKAPEHEVKTASLINAWFEIPPGEGSHKEIAKLKLPTDVTILGFLPHMHLRGKACSYEAVSPDGKTETILDIPRYDFNWQLLYRYGEPRTFKEGTLLRFNAVFDNSEQNPANPDPSKSVHWGEQTYDEMVVGYIEYYIPTGSRGGDLSSIEQHRQEGGLGGNREAMIFQSLDSNDDGKLTLEELKKLADNPRLKQANPLTIGVFFTALDKDGDKFLTPEEFQKFKEIVRKKR